jgi:hypothetical protein
VAAHGMVSGLPVLVADRGLGGCLDASSPQPGAAARCLTATIAMVTAESPNIARHVLVVTPRLWDPNELEVRQIRALLTGASYAIGAPLTSPPPDAPELTMTSAQPPGAFSRRVLRDVDDLLALAHEVGSLFPGSAQAAQLRTLAVACLAESTSKEQATTWLEAGMQLGKEMTDAVTIETTGRFTVPTASTEIPFTVVNDASEAVSVGIAVTADNPSRLTSTLSETVTVDSGQRVVVPVQVSITGVGTIGAAAHLVTADGTRVGQPVRLTITTTASQRFARNLVWIALAALLVLSGNSWRTRRNRT